MSQQGNRQILIVDDNRLVAHVFARPLTQAGYTVTVVDSGAEALVVAAERGEQIAFALLDIQMPEMDGPETAARLRQLIPGLRYAFVTGNLGKYTAEQLLQDGARAVYAKPLPIGELLDAVRQILSDLPGNGGPARLPHDPSSGPLPDSA